MAPKCCMLVCGGGNGAHVLAGLGAADPETETRVLTLFQDEAERWTNNMKTCDFIVHQDGKQIKGKPDLVSKDPSIAKGCNVIVFVVPAFAHAQYMTAIKDYIDPGTAIVGMPGQAGFEFDVWGILGDKSRDVTLLAFENLPWACRVKDFGKEVEVLGTKGVLTVSYAAGRVPSTLPKPTDDIQRVFGAHPVIELKGHILGMTLMSVNACVHPAVLYDRFKDYNDEDLDTPPLFYEGITELATDIMAGVSDEVMATAKAIMQKHPEVDLTNVIHIYQWYTRCYADEIPDKSSLFKCIRYNKAYVGLTHAMKPSPREPQKFVPNFGYRYFTEDVPYGLAVLKGIAQVVGVSTPTIDTVLGWMQSKLGREFLKDGTISGKDVSSCRAPQRYNFTTVEQVLGLH